MTAPGVAEPTKFDPVAYLEKIDPHCRYEARQLSGGIVNLTYRVQKSDTSTNLALGNATGIGRFPVHKSLILKHALPYVAGVGEHATLTLRRQQVEGEALKLLGSGILANNDKRSDSPLSVETPQLIYFDEEAHVLVLEDLGPLANLSDTFKCFGGWIGEQPPTSGIPWDQLSLVSSTPGSVPSDIVKEFAEIGTSLGSFFSVLHNNQSARKLLKDYSSRFENKELKESVLEYSIKPVAQLLKQFPQFLSSDDKADELVGWAVDQAQRSLSDEEISFILGDCWTGSVLIYSSSAATPILHGKHSSQQKDTGRVAVIDWEFSTFGKGPHGDMAQLLAHLELFRISAHQPDSPDEFDIAKQCLNALTNSLITRYARIPAGFDNVHQHVSKPEVASGWKMRAAPDPSSRYARMLRAAFLSHGVERIDCAFWKKWSCFSATCGHGTRDVPPHECVVVQQIVQSGLWFLLHACRDVAAFCQADNWDEIAAYGENRASSNEKWLGDLFINIS